MKLVPLEFFPEEIYLEDRMYLEKYMFERKYLENQYEVVLGYIETTPPVLTENDENIFFNGKTYLPVKIYESLDYGSMPTLFFGTINDYGGSVANRKKALETGFLIRNGQ